MKFVLSAAPITYWWPITVRIPHPDKAGAIIEQTFKMLFEPEDQDEAIEQAEIYASLPTLRERVEHERRQMRRVSKGWDDVVDDNKAAVAFSEENLSAALQRKWFRDAVFKGYTESLNGEARLGN